MNDPTKMTGEELAAVIESILPKDLPSFLNKHYEARLGFWEMKWLAEVASRLRSLPAPTADGDAGEDGCRAEVKLADLLLKYGQVDELRKLVSELADSSNHFLHLYHDALDKNESLTAEISRLKAERGVPWELVVERMADAVASGVKTRFVCGCDLCVGWVRDQCKSSALAALEDWRKENKQ